MIQFTKSTVSKGLIGVGLFVAYYFAANAIFGYICPSMIFVGLPCPGCGITRAGILLITGDFSGSFHMNPILLPALVWGVVAAILKLRWPDKYKYANWLAVVLVVFMLATFVVRMIMLFPHTQPLVINDNSIFHRLLYLIRG